MSNFIVAEYDVPTVAKWIVNRPQIRIDAISTKSVSSNVAFSTLIPPSSFSEATNQPFPVIASTVAGEFLVPVENAGACTRKRMNSPEGILSANAFMGLPGEELCGCGWRKVIHPDDAPRAQAAWDQAVQSRQPYKADHRIRRNHGLYCWVAAHGQPVRTQGGQVQTWVGTLVEIQGQRQATE